MKLVFAFALALALVGPLGCSSAPPNDDRSNVTDAAPPSDSGASCEDVSTPEPCNRPDGLAGHCAYGICVISCNDASVCPLSTCRTAHCITEMCQYVGMIDGSACAIGDKVGVCESSVCVVIP